GREAAGRGGTASGEDGLGVLTARLAQMRVQIDQAGEGEKAVGVDGHQLDAVPGVGGVRTQRGDDTVAQDQVGRLLTEEAGPQDQVVGAHAIPSSPASSRYRAAIRTATPLPTCSTI